MNVIFLSNSKLLPADNGASLYSLAILQHLKKMEHEITLVNFYTEKKYNAEERARLELICKNVYEIKHHKINIIWNISLKYPVTIKKYFRKSMLLFLQKLNKQKKYDAIIFDHLHMSTYAYYFKNIKKILVEHNVEHEIWRKYLEISKGIKWPLVWFLYKRIESFEKQVLKKFDTILAISKEDKEKLEQIHNNLNVIEFKPSIEFPRVKTKENIVNTNNSILFIGSMTWFPNQDAVRFLVNELMPILRKERPGILLYLVGKDPPDEIISYSTKYKDVIVTGTVESVDPFIKKSDIFINPIFMGSGLNIKLVEAMSKGVPIISSEFGCRGFELINDTHIMIFNNVNDLKDKILYLLENHQKRLELVEKSLSYIYQINKPLDFLTLITRDL